MDVKGLELAQWAKFHRVYWGKSTDGNSKKAPGLVRWIWVAYLDKNSHHGKLGEKEAAAYRHAIPNCGNRTYFSWIPTDTGLYKSGTSRRTAGDSYH